MYIYTVTFISRSSNTVPYIICYDYHFLKIICHKFNSLELFCENVKLILLRATNIIQMEGVYVEYGYIFLLECL